MSLELRQNALETKEKEIIASAESHGRKLKSLWLISKLVGAHPKQYDLDYQATTPDLLRWLDANDISKGRLFQESSLPSPEIITPPPTRQRQPNLRAPSPLATDSPLSPVSNSASRLTASQERKSKSPSPLPPKQNPTLSVASPSTISPTPPRSPIPIVSNTSPQEEDFNETSVTQGASIVESDVFPLTTHENAPPAEEEDSAKSKPQKERPAKVIHLPPKEVQEKHLHDIERAQENARIRERKEDENLAMSMSVPIPDAASSPSSTAGAYSTSTPKPPHQSPDTSPDAEYSPNTRRAQGSATPEEGTLLVKDGQMEGIEMNGTSSVTPEAQLRLEEEEAIRSAIESSNSIGFANANAIDSGVEMKDLSLAAENGDSATMKQPAGIQKPKAGLNPVAANVANSESPAVFRTPKRPSIITNTGDLNVDTRDMSAAPISATPITASRATIIEHPTRRMTTRVASGAIRQKSVSEILGETPRPSATHSERRSSQQQIIGSPLTLRETATTPTEDKSRHSMVVFSKKEKSLSPIRGRRYEPDGYLALKGASEDPEKDYLRPLFLHQAYLPPRATALTDLIADARKTVNTSNMYSNLREGMDYRILRRIYQLQNANKWSLRQMARFPDPAPPITHQHHLMAEMRWMRTDFREERSWKAAAARRLAESCAIFVAAPPQEKAMLRIKARIPPTDQSKGLGSYEEPPELVHSASTESGDSLPDNDSPKSLLVSTVAPTALFSLGYDDVIFELDPTPARDGILNELPLYDTKPLQRSPFISAGPSNVLIPVSKYSNAKLVPKPSGPPKKRSRYDYESEEDESATEFPSNKRRERRASEVSLFTSPARLSPRYKELPPEETDVALFNPLNRHIRERLHANHAFRPPSEFQMPSTNFFEHRIASQWTWDEDQKLRLCVKKFSYNWSLIAMELQEFSQPSMYVAASERRTPWECFERWYQLEGLPNDMDKTSYFRTYRSRIEAANRTVAAQHQAAQQSQAPGASQPARRRPSTQPYRVERRRDSRYINMIDAIRKLARKRETAQHRQQESAKAAALRKQHNEANQTRNTGIHTPQEFSRMKYEREVKILERQEIYRQQMLQQQKMAHMQRNQMQGQQQGPPGTPQQPRNGIANGPQGPSPPGQMSNGQPGVNGIARHPSQNMMPNGMPNQGMNSVGMNMPQAQMQNMQGQHRMNSHSSQDNLRMQMQQRAAQQQLQMQAQAANQRNNIAQAHLGVSNANFQNPQMMAASIARSNGMPNGVGGSPGSSTSPRGFHSGQVQLSQQNQQMSNGPVAIEFHKNQVAMEFPNFPPEQILKLAHERLKGQMQRMQASALSAASGSPAPNMNMGMGQGGPNQYHTNGMPGGLSPTQYQQQQMRLQQQQQQARLSGSPSLSNARPVSRSATPQGQQPLHHQRAGSGPGVPDESPRLPQAQMARP